jgi:hypothetical protein
MKCSMIKKKFPLQYSFEKKGFGFKGLLLGKKCDYLICYQDHFHIHEHCLKANESQTVVTED